MSTFWFSFIFTLYFYFSPLRAFHTNVFHWSLSVSKSPQVNRTLLSSLSDLNTAVVWIVSTCPLISKSSIPFTNPLGIVPSAPITSGITVTFMIYAFSSLARLIYLCLFSTSLDFTLWSAGKAKSTIQQVLFFFLAFFFFFFFWLSLDLVDWLKLGCPF